MASNQVSDARLRIERANTHLQELKTLLTEAPNTFTVAVKDHESGGQHLIHDVPDAENLRKRIAIIAGDALNNLKSALDYAWIGVLERHRITLPSRPKFPVYEDAHGVKDALVKSRIAQGSVLFNYMMNQCRPFKDGEYTLWAMHRLNNHDKHRLLLPTMSYAGITGIAVLNTENGEMIEGDSWGISGDGPYYVYLQSSLRLKNPGKLSVSFLFDKDMPYHPVEVDDALRDFARVALVIVNQLETI